MTLPASGSISLGDVMTELRVTNPGRAYPISLGDSDVRALAGVPSGAISLSNLYGKSSYTPMSGSVPDVSDTDTIGTGGNHTHHTPISVSVSGGTAPFSYAWTKLSGAGNVTATNAASTTADFVVSGAAFPGAVLSLVAQCVVTDSTGTPMTRSGTVTLTLE